MNNYMETVFYLAVDKGYTEILDLVLIWSIYVIINIRNLSLIQKKYEFAKFTNSGTNKS